MSIETKDTFTERVGVVWCGLMHDTPMWPIHGQYECATCGRHYAVPWGGAQPVRLRRARSSSLRRAALLLLIALSLLTSPAAQAAEASAAGSSDLAARAFARYIVNQAQAPAWDVETVEVDASLPAANTHGRMRAIRRLLLGKPDYQVLELAGDKTVRQQVILRYLSAQTQQAELPASAVAITPVNYDFHYLGEVNREGVIAYAFGIKPRKKREGLIQGELWIDGETGAVVRESGRLVKNPSIFLKRVSVTRLTQLRDGVALDRVTYLTVDTRLIGRAELVIHEQPFSNPADPAAPPCEER